MKTDSAAVPPLFHPLVADWFRQRFGEATECQARAWAALGGGSDVLISAPTGSGKTLAAFLLCIDRLVRAAADGGLQDGIQVVYVSPLKALSTDVHKNLDGPLAGIAALAAGRGAALAPIRTALRTGDTTPAERQRMATRPPHILVTTPESLFILLTAERSRRALAGTRTVVVDEIHAVVDDKRGAHLALSLARLDDLVRKAGGRSPQRIGLSATVRPIEEVGRYLTPSPGLRIVDTGHRRPLDLAVEVPGSELGAVASKEMWGEIYHRLATLVRTHRTTLVFVNTRRLAERVAHCLEERLGEEAVLAHHGSLSRRLRLAAEDRLKRGELRAVVATASLELGIDVGTVDLVCQLGSPRSIAVALQRVGRSGHHVDVARVPKGRFFPTTRDELVESAALVRAIRSGGLDGLTIPAWPRDILAQQIVAAAAAEAWREDDLFALVRAAFPYRDLPRPEFDAVIAMLSDGIATARGRGAAAFLHRDGVNGVVRARRGARLAAMTSGGAIPDNANYLVVAEPEGAVVGTVDEDFAVESMAGDVFLLGTTSWRIRRVEAGQVRVEDAQGAPPSIPFWRGEAPGRTAELSEEVARVREEIAQAESSDAASDLLVSQCGLDAAGAEQAAAYVRAGAAALGAVPTVTTVIAERFFDEAGGMQLVLHAPFGARVNRAWGLALRKRFCRSFNLELQAAATDDGIVISLAEQHSFPLDAVFRFLALPTVDVVLTQAMLGAPMFTARWRWNGSRALAVLRFSGGRKVPAPIQRMRSEDLLAAVFPDQAACPENLSGDIRIPDHPLVNETIRDCLHEAMDLEGLRRVIAGIQSGAIRTYAVETPEPSPFSHEILNSNPFAYLDDAPLEERRARAVQMRRTLPAEAGEVGALDAGAIERVSEEAWPVVRDAEELHDALLTLVVVPVVPAWAGLFAELAGQHRATTLHAGSFAWWVAAERLCAACALLPGARADPPLAALPGGSASADGSAWNRDSAATEVLRGWIESIGPVTAPELASRLSVELEAVETGLARLESEGQILRGRFRPAAVRPNGAVEWCNRRLLARIHRLTIGRLRREIEPVTSAEFLRFLFRWQHLAPGTQLHGVEGTLAVLEQLQGHEVPAGAWEREVLARRVADYSPEFLDRLCLSGDVMWGRLSPHPVFDETVTVRDADGAREQPIRPTRVAPIAIFLRQDAEWLLNGAEPLPRREGQASASPSAQRRLDFERLSASARAVLEQLARRGASFQSELTAATGLPPREVEEALWELSATGKVTGDGFENLRALIDSARRRGMGVVRFRRGQRRAGRWALLSSPSGAIASDDRRADAFARQLLRRWGVVFKDVLAREGLMPPWRSVLQALRRMEARGEVRGGRFVSGYLGEQFAEPAAVDALRAVRRRGQGGCALRAAAADPLNLVGILTPGPRVNPLSGQTVEVLPDSATEGLAFTPPARSASSR